MQPATEDYQTVLAEASAESAENGGSGAEAMVSAAFQAVASCYC